MLHEATSLLLRPALFLRPISLVSMANSGRISKRRILPVSMHRTAAAPTPARNGAARHPRHLLVATRRQPWQPGSAPHTVRAVRSRRLLHRVLWQHPPLRIAPDTRDPTGRPHHRPTAQPRPLAQPRPHRGLSRPVARMRVAGKTADSTGGADPSRHRSHLDHTSGMVGAGNDASRLPTLVR